MSIVRELMEEIELIQDDKIRSFTVDALDKLELSYESYSEISNLVNEIKSAILYSRPLLDTLDASDYVNDIVTSAILMQDITRYYIGYDNGVEEEVIMEDNMHPLSVRLKVSDLAREVGSETFDNILRLVESSHGFNSAIPHVIPSIEDPVYVWILPFVNELNKSR